MSKDFQVPGGIYEGCTIALPTVSGFQRAQAGDVTSELCAGCKITLQVVREGSRRRCWCYEPKVEGDSQPDE